VGLDREIHFGENVNVAATQPINPVADLEVSSRSNEFDLNYCGWRVALAACFGVMAGFGSLFVYTFSVFVKPLNAEFGWSREAISQGFAIAAVTLGGCSPLLGRWIDKCGPRRMILVCITLVGLSIASSHGCDRVYGSST